MYCKIHWNAYSTLFSFVYLIPAGNADKHPTRLDEKE